MFKSHLRLGASALRAALSGTGWTRVAAVRRALAMTEQQMRHADNASKIAARQSARCSHSSATAPPTSADDGNCYRGNSYPDNTDTLADERADKNLAQRLYGSSVRGFG